MALIFMMRQSLVKLPCFRNVGLRSRIIRECSAFNIWSFTEEEKRYKATPYRAYPEKMNLLMINAVLLSRSII